MSPLSTFKLTTVIVACLSTAIFANTQSKQMHEVETSPADHNERKQPTENLSLSRGQLLYDNHCTTCHDSNIRIRERRKSRSISDIQQWVFRWSQHLQLDWNRTDINDVTRHLNQRYYQLPVTKKDYR